MCVLFVSLLRWLYTTQHNKQTPSFIKSITNLLKLWGVNRWTLKEEFIKCHDLLQAEKLCYSGFCDRPQFGFQLWSCFSLLNTLMCDLCFREKEAGGYTLPEEIPDSKSRETNNSQHTKITLSESCLTSSRFLLFWRQVINQTREANN